MEHQGGRRGRSADDPGTAPAPPAGPGTGGHRVLSGSGAQPALDRTAARGFPPAASGFGAQTGGFGAQTGGFGTQTGGFAAQTGGFAAQTGGFAEAPTAGFRVGGYQEAATPPQGLPAADDGDPVAPAAITPGSGGRRATRVSRPRRRSSRIAWLSLAAVLVIVAGGFTWYKFLYEPRVNAPVPSSLRLPTDAPGSSPGFDQSLGKWQHIGARTQDPAPLTLEQLFPPQFELDGSSYVRTAADTNKNCTLAVFGANLQASLTAGHCSQILRASYISGNGKMMGTVGVANLIGSNAAQKAGATTGPQEIIAPLAAQKGPTSKLGNGTGVVEAEIKGHYVILMWAEFTNLKSPSTTAQRSQLEQFAANLVTGSANINLSTRMLTGKP